MNGLQQLINQLCPNGVEWETLGKLCEINKGEQLNKENMSEVGSYPVINGGICPSGYVEVYNQPKDTITISQGGASAGYVNWMKTEFWAGAHCYVVIPNKEIVSNRYVYHYVKSIESKLQECQYGAGIPALAKKTVEQVQIPLPPLAIQSRIVEILDHFTNLTANLTAELALRRKQFEHFREKLLSLDGVEGVEWKALGGVCEYSKKRIVAAELNNANYVSVENLLQNKKGKTQSECCPDAGCWTKFEVGDVLIGNIRPYLRKIWLADIIGGTNGDVLVIHIKDSDVLCPSYLYYILSSEDFFTYDTSNSKGAKMPRGDKSAVMAYSFPVPPLAVQQSIVEQLDKFTALIQNIENELALRQKQYEYCREKLLSFPSPSL
ncbi:MAG: restriction endonuclease subunit S [Bacteroidaceae bacterium]|nr:restriction endonuclease subunit S [Bacteroidaceae bacterium]